MKLLESLNEMVADLKKKNENWSECIAHNDNVIEKLQTHSDDCRKGIEENSQTITELEKLISEHQLSNSN